MSPAAERPAGWLEEALPDVPARLDHWPEWCEAAVRRQGGPFVDHTSVSGAAWVGAQPGPPSLWVDPLFRRLVAGLFAADVGSYPPGYRVSLARLGFVVHAFPAGFRLWLGRDELGWVPVGYAGWYPLSETVYRWFAADAAHADPAVLLPADEHHRADPAALPPGPVYLFNYSVVPALQRGPVAKALLTTLAAEVAPARALVADTVSPDGARVATRFGCTPRAEYLRAGLPWRLYIGERA